MGRISHHLKGKDYKKTYQRRLDEQRALCLERREREIQKLKEALILKELSAPYKSDWRKELEKIEEVSVDKFVNYEYDWRDKFSEDKKKYFEEGMTSSGMFQTTLPATGDVEYDILETDIQQSGKDLYLYYDTRVYDTLVFDARVGPGITIVLTTKPWESFRDSDILAFITTSGTYSFRVPQSQNYRVNFLKGYDPEADPSGLAAIDAVRAKRTRPIGVFVSLDSPEATAFIRTDPMMANLSPKERLKKLKEMLEASDEYVLKMLGVGFPGTGAVPPGEAGDTPGVQMVNYQGKPITDPDDYWRNVTQVSPETFQQIYQQKVASGEITPSTMGVPWSQQSSQRQASSSQSSSSQSSGPGYMDIQVGDQRITRSYDAAGNYTGADTGWQPDPSAARQETEKVKARSDMFKSTASKTQYSIDDLGAADYSAYKAGGGDAALKQGKTLQQVIDQGKANIGQYDSGPRRTMMSLSDFKSAANQAAYKAGGGDAALRRGGVTVQDIIAQGKKNLGQDDYLNSLPPGVRDDMLKGGKTSSPLGDIAILGATAAVVKGAFALGLSGLTKLGLTKTGLLASGITAGDQAKKTFVDKADNAGQYNQQLAGKLVTSILSGQPQEIKLSPAAKKDQIKNVDQEQFSQALQIGPIQKPSANSTVNPTQKRQVLTGGWGSQGGSEVRYDPKTDTLTITSEKMLRTGLKGDKFDGDRQTAFGDIPEPTDAQVSDMTKKLMTGPLEPLMQGLSGVAQVLDKPVNASNFTGGPLPGREPTGGGANTWDEIKSDPIKLQTFSDNMGKAANDLAKGAVQGTASNTVVLRKVLTNLGFPQSEVEKTGGGYGQVYSQTSYTGNEIPKEVRGIINTKLSGISESFKRKKILSEVKKPYILVEVKKEKIKHRPKVIKPNDCGTRVVGADLMKQAEVPTSFKRIEDTMWKKQERAQNTRFSQERKNMILDSVGTADHAWEWMTDKSKKKNEKSVYENFGPKNSANEDLKNRIISKKQVGNDSIIKMYNENGEIEIITQSVLNERLQKEYELQLKEQETLNAPNDPLVKRIKNKLYTQIDYPDKPAKMGYPNELPLPLGQDGYHIQYGDRADYYNRLDRHSADTMSNPLTGNEKIDAKVLDQTTSAKVNKLITKMRDKKKQSKINSSLENQ